MEERNYYEALLSICNREIIAWNITAVKFNVRPSCLYSAIEVQQIKEFDKDLIFTEYDDSYFISINAIETPAINSHKEIGEILGYISPYDHTQNTIKRDSIAFFIRNHELIAESGEIVHAESCIITDNIIAIDNLLTKFCDFTDKLGLYCYVQLGKTKKINCIIKKRRQPTLNC